MTLVTIGICLKANRHSYPLFLYHVESATLVDGEGGWSLGNPIYVQPYRDRELSTNHNHPALTVKLHGLWLSTSTQSWPQLQLSLGAKLAMLASELRQELL